MSDRRTITLPRNGTLPTLEKLLTEMAALEEQTSKVEVSFTNFQSRGEFYKGVT